ncbi:MAG: iron ABC transporter permease [Alcanivorax sp.]|nr:iron ABC transporter permease [Alcanivorax sp.]
MFSSPALRSLVLLLLALALATPVLVVAGSWLAGASPNWGHLSSTVLPSYLRHSLFLALFTGTGTLLIGVAAAWAVSRFRFPGRRVLEWALLLPLACPAYLIAYTWTGMLASEGALQQALPLPLPDIRSPAGAGLMLTLVLYPYVYLMTRAAFVSQSAVALEVARTLGAGPWRRFFRVALPLARPAIIAGLALVLMETLADYGTVAYFGVPTLSTGIYRTWFGLGDAMAAAQLAGVLLLAMVVLLTLERRARKERRISVASARAAAPLPLGRGPGLLLAAALWLPVLLGFILPALQLLVWSLPRWRDLAEPGFLGLLGTSLLIALCTALAATGLGLLLIWARRLRGDRPRRLAAGLAGFGYAVPGTVLAVGVVLVLASLDRGLNDLLASVGLPQPGLLFSGTLFAVVFACTVRFLTIPIQGLDAGLQNLSPNLDNAARSLGTASLPMLRRVHLPLLRVPLATSALLVFVDTLKELPAALVLRPFNTNTLAVRAFELASDERLADAALPALTILLAGVAPVILLTRSIRNPHQESPHADH